jgi:hypothetical protein
VDTGDAPLSGPDVDPDRTADDVAAALSEAVRFGVPSFVGWRKAWDEAMAHAEDTCPEGYQTTGLFEVYDPLGCTTSEGWTYSGVGGSGGAWDLESNSFRAAWKVDLWVANPEDQKLSAGGHGESTMEFDGEQEMTFQSEMYGTYGWEASQSWLHDGVSVAYEATGGSSAANAWGNLTGGFTLGENETIYLSDLSWGDTACGTAPTGEIALRDANGRWYRLQFDESSCDGCGVVDFDNRHDLGTTCVDLLPALESFVLDMVDHARAAANEAGGQQGTQGPPP